MQRDLHTARQDVRGDDTRRKIQLGGLVIKAGLKGMKPSLILGILVDGERRSRANLADLERYEAIGDQAFSK